MKMQCSRWETKQKQCGKLRFQTVFFVSQREHCIFIEGVVDWCHILLHKEAQGILFYLQQSQMPI